MAGTMAGTAAGAIYGHGLARCGLRLRTTDDALLPAVCQICLQLNI